MEKQDRTTVILIAIGFLVLASASLFVLRGPIAIEYHRWRINSLLKQKPELDTVSGFYCFGNDWCEAFDKHKDKLVELGYLYRKEFPFTNISYPSLESRRLFEELGSRFPNNPYTTMRGYEPNTTGMITVWDQPEKLPEWERIIRAHDAPAANIVDMSQGRLEDILPFAGSWVTENKEPCYIITECAETLKIETPSNNVWRTVLKNIRADGKRILFDMFHYIDPNENFKSIVDRSGEHPFSGVRCEAVFELNPNDSNELFYHISSVSKYGTYKDPNVAVLRRLE